MLDHFLGVIEPDKGHVHEFEPWAFLQKIVKCDEVKVVQTKRKTNEMSASPLFAQRTEYARRETGGIDGDFFEAFGGKDVHFERFPSNKLVLDFKVGDFKVKWKLWLFEIEVTELDFLQMLQCHKGGHEGVVYAGLELQNVHMPKIDEGRNRPLVLICE